jgi:hypothetical protein
MALEAPGAAAAGVDLALDHPDRTAQFLGGFPCLLDRVGHAAAGYGDPVFREQGLGLVFVNVHPETLV